MSYIPTCPYCGQSMSSNGAFCTRTEADEYAAEHCDCDTATFERRKREQVHDAQERVRRLFGASAEQYGFKQEKDDEIVSILNNIVESIANNRLQWATLRINKGGKVTIALTAKGGIRVQRSITHACQLEE